VVLKVGEIGSLAAIVRARGRKSERYGEKQHKGGENAQPLIDHQLIFSSLKQFIR